MVESKLMTILYNGETENDITERLDNMNIEYTWIFSTKDNSSSIEYTTDKTYRVLFENGICQKVLKKDVDKLARVC